jgi:hypothetical protein
MALTRAAASSSASGMPSSWRQMRATAAEFSAVSRNDGEAKLIAGFARSGVRRRQRRHAPCQFARDIQCFAAAGEDAQPAAGPQGRRGEPGTAFDQVLAVVENQQEISATKKV